jgi:hypothetical protein
MQLFKQQQQVELMQRQEHQSKLELDKQQLQACPQPLDQQLENQNLIRINSRCLCLQQQ